MCYWLGSLTPPEEQQKGGLARFDFAVEQTSTAVQLHLDLQTGSGQRPSVTLEPAAAAMTGPGEEQASGVVRYTITVPPAAGTAPSDQRLCFALLGTGVPRCEIELRRSGCSIQTALLERGDPKWKLDEQTLAALRWQACERYVELVGLKRFSTGLSGSEVLVFRPRLAVPKLIGEDFASSGPAEVLDGAWGAWLLVKTGKIHATRQEWVRFDQLMRDRLNPFLARTEAYIPAQPLLPAGDRATLVSSFLGGDLIRAEPLDQVLGSTTDLDRCLKALDRTFDVLAPWHTAGVPRPLGDWPRVFRTRPTDGRLLLFNKFDLGQELDRSEYTAGLRLGHGIHQVRPLAHLPTRQAWTAPRDSEGAGLVRAGTRRPQSAQCALRRRPHLADRL